MQPSFSAIHDPYPEASSERRRQFKAHRDCRSRIDAAAKPPTAAVISPPPPPPPPPAPVFSIKDWVERQKKIPLPAFQVEESKSFLRWRSSRVQPLSLLTVRDIQIACAKFFNVELGDLLSDSRRSDHVNPRQIAMYLTRELTGRPMTTIGRAFGGRDHTTVLHAIKKIASLIRSDEALAHDIADLELSLSVAS